MPLKLLPEQIRFIESGASLSAASRDRRYLPSVARVLACKAAADGHTLRICLAKSQASQLVQDALDSDQLALVISDPPTHRTWQIKGDTVSVLAITAEDSQHIETHIDAFANLLTPLNYSRAFCLALYEHQAEDLVCLKFHARELFEQTPGPNAGKLLADSAAEPGTGPGSENHHEGL